VSWGVIPIGAVLGGLLAREMGAHHAALVGAVGVAAATLWIAVSPIPRLRQAPGAADLAADPGGADERAHVARGGCSS
jgi:hypothetical protein